MTFLNSPNLLTFKLWTIKSEKDLHSFIFTTRKRCQMLEVHKAFISLPQEFSKSRNILQTPPKPCTSKLDWQYTLVDREKNLFCDQCLWDQGTNPVRLVPFERLLSIACSSQLPIQNLAVAFAYMSSHEFG